MICLFKIGTALVFAVIAALTVILAGLMANARYSVIFFRGMTGFLIAGGLVYLAGFLLERYELPAFWRRQQEEQSDKTTVSEDTVEDEPTEEEAEAASKKVDAVSDQQEETSERKAVESGGADGFVPLATDGLKHVSSPQD